jgi:hypothetical protein
MQTVPSIIAIVAGAAPFLRTISSTSLATSRLVGLGSPWLIIVDSRATIGAPDLIACATSGEKFIKRFYARISERINP